MISVKEIFGPVWIIPSEFISKIWPVYEEASDDAAIMLTSHTFSGTILYV